MEPISCDSFPSPTIRSCPEGPILKHVGRIPSESSNDNSRFVSVVATCGSRINADDDTVELRMRRDAAFIEYPPIPQRARNIIQDFRVQFLPAESRAFVALDHVLP